MFPSTRKSRKELVMHLVKMNCSREWKPVVVMVAVNFALAMVNLLLKKVLNEGVNQ